MARKKLLPVEQVEHAIYFVRGERVMLDEDLAKLYGVDTRTLNQAVTRHGNRFPSDFSFLLTPQEVTTLKSQIVISKEGRGGRRYRLRAFTEQGVAMLSSVLNGKKAIEVNILIMRTFVRMRKVDEHDRTLVSLFEEIRRLLSGPDESTKMSIGFQAD